LISFEHVLCGDKEWGAGQNRIFWGYNAKFSPEEVMPVKEIFQQNRRRLLSHSLKRSGINNFLDQIWRVNNLGQFKFLKKFI